ncbi:MAG: GNAT family N-acetyltransferase [Terriglobia bacterium]
MQLRAFRPSDLQRLHEIDQSCFAPGISYSRGELEGFIRHRDAVTWVAEEGNETVGFLIANRHPTKSLGHIITIDVVDAWRRKGVGKALMDAAEEWARRRHLICLSLETAEDNLIAQAFYEKRGYVKHDRLEGYYSDGTGAWTMVKWLVPPEVWLNQGAKPAR